MRHLIWLRLFGSFLLIPFFAFGNYTQNKQTPPVEITVISEEDLIPSIIKALPDREKVEAIQIKNLNELKKALGDRNVFDLIDFEGGAEGATANYDAGKLLIIEFQTPQFSVDADNKIKQRLNESQPNPQIFYRRVGNYSAFIFDPKDEVSANALLDQVKYDKVVQWLGEDPNYLKRAEEYFIKNTSQLFISTVIAFVSGIGIAVLLGIICGIFFFRWRNRQRDEMPAFSDTGGMIRLNLDQLTPEISTEKFLKE